MEDTYSMKWAVVQFENNSEEDSADIDIATVPRTWIFVENGQVYCYWPTTKIRKHIQKATKPSDTWRRFEAAILKETVSYEDALKYEKKKVTSSGSESDEQFGRGARKRKAPKDDDYFSDIDQCLERAISPPPKLIAEKMVDEACESSDPDTSDTLTISDSDSLTLMPPPAYVPPKKKNAVLKSVEKNSSSLNANKININVEAAEVEPLQNNLENINIEKSGMMGICCSHGERILEIVVATRTLVREQRAILEKSVGVISPQAQDIVQSFDTVPKVPIKLYRKLLQYEDVLKDSDEAKNQLQVAFYMCGGENPKEAIRRGLAKIFADKLAKKCSWTGRKENFQLKELTIMNLLKVAVRKRYNIITDKLFETLVSTWFRQAQLRYDRKKKNKTM